MTRFEYVSIFNGIVVAVALENVASSFHKLLEAGDRVRWHWMAPTNAIGASIATLGQFWLWWVGRDAQFGQPTFLTFVPAAVTAIPLYLVCAATLPDSAPESGIDLRRFYFSSRRQLWSLVLAVTLLRLAVEVLAIMRAKFDPRMVDLDAPFLAGSLAGAAVAGSMIFVRAPWWNGLGIIAVTAGTILLFGPMKL